MHLVTTANIHVFSSPSGVPPSPGLPAGGWKATFLPSRRGNCFTSASRLVFSSRENEAEWEGPTEPRRGTVMVTPRVLLEFDGVADAVEDGDGARGRLFLFSTLPLSACGRVFFQFAYPTMMVRALS